MLLILYIQLMLLRARHIIILVIASFFTMTSAAQTVSVSKEFNIRSDYAYELLGNVGDNILLYRDRGMNKMMVAFDKDLQFLWENELYFEQKKIRVYGLTSRDSLVSIFYGMKKDGVEYLKAGYYDQSARLIDSVIIAEQPKDLIGQKFQFVNSANSERSLLYYIDQSDKLNVLVYDHKRDTLDWKQEFLFNNTNLNYDLLDVQLMNSGSIVLLLDKESEVDNQDMAEIIILTDDTKTGYITQIPFGDKYLQSYNLSIDEENNKLGYFALYNEKNTNWSQGYGYTYIDLGNFHNVYNLTYREIDKSLLEDLYGTSRKKKKGLDYFQLSDVIWRQDGGVVVIMEMEREFSRRNNYDVIGRTSTDYYGTRGWVDYFNEDLLLISLHPNGDEHWREILYKKQFSQDDGGIYASYFPFLTPSRLRLLYNDEIKNDNTVSEYILNGLGHYKRESVLSTEYQKLKLRFIDAIQISSTEILVPSQRNYNLALVKISY